MKMTYLPIIVALCTYGGCQKAAPTPVPAADAATADNALAPVDSAPSNDDGAQSGDGSAGQLTDADAVQLDTDSDTTEEITDVADSVLDVAADADAEVEVDADTALGFDAIYIADAGSPTCADKYGPMPMPGQPCSKVGEVRCSDYQAQEGALPYGPKVPVCIRYNRVLCTQGSDGAPTWMLLPCPEVDANACKTPSIKAICIDYPEGGVCAPWLPGGVAACVSDDVGKLDCLNTGTESLYSCRKPSEPAGDSITNQIIKSEYAWLTTCCPDCRFWLPWQLCPKVNICDCKEVPPQECPGNAGDSHVCIESLDGGGPGCATNCSNVKQWSGWDQGFK